MTIAHAFLHLVVAGPASTLFVLAEIIVGGALSPWRCDSVEIVP